MASDRIFGLVMILMALAYIASAFQIQTSFLADPVGSKTFPVAVGIVVILCGLVFMVKPDGEPEWPDLRTWGRLAFAVAVLVAYSYALKPMGFLVPTVFTAGLLAYQITPKPAAAVMAGFGLSVGLFIVFRYGLGLGLQPFPKGLLG